MHLYIEQTDRLINIFLAENEESPVFVGNCLLRTLADRSKLEIVNIAARRKCGGILLNHVLAYCGENNLVVTTSRDGCMREQVYKRFSEILNSDNPNIRITKLNALECAEIIESGEWVDVDMLGFTLVNEPVTISSNSIKSDWYDYFSIAYENDSSSILDELEPPLDAKLRI